MTNDALKKSNRVNLDFMLTLNHIGVVFTFKTSPWALIHHLIVIPVKLPSVYRCGLAIIWPFLISFPHGWDSFTIQFAECHKAEPRRDETIPSPKSNKIVTYFSYPAHIFQTNSPGGNWHPRPRYLETELGEKKHVKTWKSIKNHLQGHRKAP